MDTPTLIIAIIAIVLGAGIIYWINRRKFYRRNVAGLEGFSSFESSVFVRLLELIGRWIAYALIIIGILSLLMYLSGEKGVEEKNQNTEIIDVSK